MHSNTLTQCRGVLIVVSGLLCTHGTDAAEQTEPGSVGCAPYPAFPDASCTGWQHTGVTLTSYTGPKAITVAGTVIDSKLINGDLVVLANNVTIKRSKILGIVRAGYGKEQRGLVLEDVEIDGKSALRQCVGDAYVTIRRANIYNCMQGVQAEEFTLVDSYIHDLYGAEEAHSEALLGKGNNQVVVHNRLEGVYGNQGNWAGTGGMSSAVSFYTHGDFWGAIDNLWFEKNYLKVGTGSRDYASYCLYAGSYAPGPNGSGNEVTNATFIDNVFERNSRDTSKCGLYGTIAGDSVPNDTGNNCWSNNKFEGGGAIMTSLPACTISTKSNPSAELKTF